MEVFMKIENLPKIELHCHLDGSIRPRTVLDIAMEEDITMPSMNIDIIREMLIAPANCKSLNDYLKRFDLPIAVMQSKKSLRKIAFELFEDAALENVKYIEIRFAPLQHIKKGLTIEETIENVLRGIKDAEDKYDIKGNLIICCMRNMSVKSAFEVVESGKKFLNKGVVGIDLCGDEEKNFSKRFVEPIRLAREYGYKVTIHAGETGIGQNVLEAVELLGAERIGHGVYIKDCLEAYNVVKNKGVYLEICPTSNIQTKAIERLSSHPIYDFYKDDILVTVNTDNRTVSDTTMTNEIKKLENQFQISIKDYKTIYSNSIEASFADSNTKERLRNYKF
jgi:adenosine deaminase